MNKAASMTLVYGDSGAGKTALIESLAIWVWRKYKKKTRLITGDGGGWDNLQHLVDMGIIEPWQVDTFPNPFETLNLAAEGYWPQDVNNPQSELLPPVNVTYKAFCGKCKKFIWDKITPPGTKFICSVCKSTVAAKNSTLGNPTTIVIETVRVPNKENDLTKYAVYAFEGLTAFGNFQMNSLIDRGARGEKIGAEAPAKFTDGKQKFASSNMTYYGIIQNRLHALVNRTRLLPEMHVYWTALEMRATDQDTKLPIFGPELVGKAKTGVAPAWFGNTLSVVQWPEGDKTQRRLYLKTYYDRENPSIPHNCKNRIPALVAGDIPDFLVLDGVKKPEESWGLGLFLDLVESKRLEAKKLYGKDFVK